MKNRMFILPLLSSERIIGHRKLGCGLSNRKRRLCLMWQWLLLCSAAVCSYGQGVQKDFALNGKSFALSLVSVQGDRYLVVMNLKTRNPIQLYDTTLAITKDMTNDDTKDQIKQLVERVNPKPNDEPNQDTALAKWNRENAQLEDMVKMRMKEGIEEIKKQNDSSALSDKLKAALNPTNIKMPIGLVKKRGWVKVRVEEKPPMHSGSGKSIYRLEDAEIDHILIRIREGAIQKRGILVYMKNGDLYTNYYTALSMASFAQDRNKFLYISNRKITKFIKLEDAIDYIPFDEGTFPSDTDEPILLNDKTPTDTLKYATDIGVLADVRVYSDLLGMFGKKSNGIVQTDLKLKLLTNTRSVYSNSDLLFHNFFELEGNYSKFDSKQGQIQKEDLVTDLSDTNDPKHTVDRSRLYQISFLNTTLRTNILKIGIGTNQNFYVNLLSSLHVADADSAFNKFIFSFGYGPELWYSYRRYKNMELSLVASGARNQIMNRKPFENYSGVWFLRFGIEFSYYPYKKNSNRMFARINSVSNLNQSGSNFCQLQLGYTGKLF